MTDRDRAELEAFLEGALARALQKHTCRFPEDQAASLHEAAKRLTPDDIIVVAWIARRLQSIGAAAGTWFGRLVTAGLVALLVAGAVAIAWGIRRGWISPISP